MKVGDLIRIKFWSRGLWPNIEPPEHINILRITNVEIGDLFLVVDVGGSCGPFFAAARGFHAQSGQLGWISIEPNSSGDSYEVIS